MNNKRKIFNLSLIILVGLANLLIAAFILLSFKYIKADIKTFASIYGILICLLVIMNICFYYGFNYRGKLSKLFCFIFALILFISGTIGTFYIGKLNDSIGNIIENEGIDQYEIIRGSIVTYNNTKYESIKDLKGRRVGLVKSNAIGVSSVSKSKFESESVEPIYIEYSSNNDLFLALVKGEVDAACMQSSYKTQFAQEEGYEIYIDDLKDIYTFEEKVKTGENQSANLDLSVEPFSVLLIGYAPEVGGGGLADTIILASINPKTLVVTLTSVARDTYTTISCTGGKAKINSARAQSRACLMETVGDLLDTKIDFYAEINFLGLVDIIDALGGIYIDSPVEFVGQSPSSLRGEFTVWVPKGPYHASGEQALAFARERHAMPNGDFDRQIHQQEVISEMVKGLIELKDVNKALGIMKAAGENFSTNLSIKQLTDVFNYIINLPNYTGIGIFDMINMQTMRVTGYASWYYDYPMRLPQWIYKAYNGSIKENIERINDTLGEYDKYDQEPYFKFFEQYIYIRDVLYSNTFNEPIVSEEMPDYYPYLTKMTYSDVLAWANARGIKLEITAIEEGNPNYVASEVGSVLAQEPRYGALVSEFKTAKITIMGSALKPEDRIPNFKDKALKDLREWCTKNNYKIEYKWLLNEDVNKAGIIVEQDLKAGDDKSKYDKIVVSVYDYPSLDLSALVQGMKKADLDLWINNNLLVEASFEYIKDKNKEANTLISYSYDNQPNPAKMNSKFVFKLVEHEHDFHEVEGSRVEPTVDTEGKYERKCDSCGTIEIVTIPKIEVLPPSASGEPNSNEENGN